ncbi:putative staphylopine/pseudopaline/yersinopine synthase [Hollandina sp. SP2]
MIQQVLILGTGPTAIQIAINFKNKLGCSIGIAGRISVRSKNFFTTLYQNNNRICANVQNKNHILLAGECFIDDIFIGYETVNGEWDTIIATITSNAYISVIKQLDISVLRHVQCFILVSPTIGSNSLVNSFLKQSGCSAEVVSFSTYYAATERRNSFIEVLTKNVKKKIYIGSTHKDSEIYKKLIYLFQQFGIMVELTTSPCEAESRNISIYVHPPIFMNEYALKSIFREDKTIRYGYKFYPEGPLTQYVMHDLLIQWKEIMDIIHHFKVEGFNLLKFMIDDNYPV